MSGQRQTTKSAPGYSKSRSSGLFLGTGFLLMVVLLPPPESMTAEAWSALGLMLLMATWWSTEAIPIPATALLPIVLIPALGLGSTYQATASYAHPIIFLFLGGFTLGLAMQRWNLHRRIALMTLKAVGYEPKRQIAGFMLATAFLSMWVSNTATAIMMLPIGLSVIAMMGNGQPENIQRYGTALLLAIAYSASIGGIATLIGTPPNALLAAYLETQGIMVGFAQWMLLGIPVASVMLALVWWWLTRREFGLPVQEHAGQTVHNELVALGQMSRAEIIVAAVFVLTAGAWVFRPLLSGGIMPWLTDTGIAVSAAIAMFIIPVDIRQRTFVLDWDTTARGIPWGILLLFGGGLALAGVISSSGLAEWLAASISTTGALPLIVMLVLIVAVIIFLTEVTSNTATAATFLPLLGALAISQEASPLLLAVPAAIAASCAFMMPVATPPNAIVFSSGHIKMGDMIRAGFALNIASIVVVTLLCYLLMDFVFTL